MTKLKEYLLATFVVLLGLTTLLKAERGPYYLIGRHPDTTSSSSTLIQPTDITYLGGFRIPQGFLGSSHADFTAQSIGMEYNPTHNTIYLSGYAPDGQIVELNIPTLVDSYVNGTGMQSDLNTATVQQNYTDPSEGGRLNIVPDNPGSVSNYVGGMLLDNGNLYVNYWPYYDNFGVLSATFKTNPDFTVTGEVTGPWRLNASYGAGLTSGWYVHVPSAWQSAIGGPVLTGLGTIPIYGRTSWGPAAFVLNPADIGVTNPVPSLPLIIYPVDHPNLSVGNFIDPMSTMGDLSTYQVNEDHINSGFNAGTQIGGAVFPTGYSSLLFWGRQGTGVYCYGSTAPDIECGDTAVVSHGPHTQPYKNKIWAYDANDLAKVKAGTMQPYDILPYKIWTIDIEFHDWNPAGVINGVAYDAVHGRIFVSQDSTDPPGYSIIHVFTLPHQ